MPSTLNAIESDMPYHSTKKTRSLQDECKGGFLGADYSANAVESSLVQTTEPVYYLT